MELKIEYVSTDKLKPYKNNAKKHPAEQIEQIKASIQEFGFLDPIAIWKGNEVIAGHGRLIAAKELGIDTVPVIRLNRLTDDKRKAYALVHNKLTMNSGFDIDLLELELNDILDIDMTTFGFDVPDGWDDEEAIRIWRDGMQAAIEAIDPEAVLLYGGALDFDFHGIRVVEYANRVTETWNKDR